MDAERFDSLSKRFATLRSRRGVLGSALAALAALAAGGTRAGAAKGCRAAGHPCGENQTCCPGLDCRVIGPGAARRCTPCAAEGASCAGDEACCGGVCCRDELIDPIGTCCAGGDRCCGRACCTDGEVCDQRFLMCVACQHEGDFCQVPFCNCCLGLAIVCDESGCRCAPEPAPA